MFDLKRARNGQYSFTLKAENGDVILNSQMYLAKKSAEAGIAMVQRNCQEDACYQRAQAADGSFFFILNTVSKQILGKSVVHPNAESRDKGIERVKASGITTNIRDMAPG
ncbi:MAG: YegP family protein [Xanthomonadaceae bacterium]|jgi:uncharacterized protein YegP (UPF0339 family)|nr:YegP family protein [Xanthomonadaceae bacterium]